MRTLLAEPISQGAFAPYGDVLTSPSEPGRTYFDVGLTNRRADVPASLSVSHIASPAALPLRVWQMERHEFSSQSFVPIDASRYLIVVAPHAPGGGPDANEAVAFIVPGDVGITYHVNVWHHPLAVLDRAARFAVFMWRDGSSQDEEFLPVAEPFLVNGD